MREKGGHKTTFIILLTYYIWQIIPDDGLEVTAKKGVIEKLVGIASPAATT